MAGTAKHIIFTGRVQGVGFRFTAYSIARRCQLTGIVRNLPDGSVEMIVQGHPEDINDCIRDLQETFGVADTKLTDLQYDPRHTEFRITY
jgi:acylphosphatase